jgi:hypothetical protein
LVKNGKWHFAQTISKQNALIGIFGIPTTCIQQVIVSSMQHDSMTWAKKKKKNAKIPQC